MTAYRKTLAWLIGYLLALEGALAFVLIRQPPVTDEALLIQTVVQFGKGISLNLLQHYAQLSPPLPFLLYALWGRIFNFDPATLRLLSVIAAIATYLLFFDLLAALSGNLRAAVISTMFIALIPYMLDFSVSVLTDIGSILCLVVCVKAIREDRPVILGIASAAGLLIRQYFAFLPLAAFVYLAFRFWLKQDRRAVAHMVALVLSLVPLGLLFILWRGISPDNYLKIVYSDDGFYFHFNSFNLYVALFPVYLFPFVLYRFWSIYRDRLVLGISAIASIYYLFFPVTPSRASLDMNILTVGVFDRVVRVILGETLDRVVFLVMFFLGFPVVLSIVKDLVVRFNQKQFDLLFLLDASILAFLLFMPFSYVGWEKYFMPVVPLTAAQMILKHNEDEQTVPSRVAQAVPNPDSQ